MIDIKSIFFPDNSAVIEQLENIKQQKVNSDLVTHKSELMLFVNKKINNIQDIKYFISIIESIRICMLKLNCREISIDNYYVLKLNSNNCLTIVEVNNAPD